MGTKVIPAHSRKHHTVRRNNISVSNRGVASIGCAITGSTLANRNMILGGNGGGFGGILTGWGVRCEGVNKCY